MTDSARTKTVEVEGVSYVIRRMTPFEGSYLWHRLMHAALLLQQEQAAAASGPTREEDEASEVAPEQRLRALCGLAYMKLTAEETRDLQERCMRVLMRVNAQTQLPMPVMADGGQWAPDGAELETSPWLLTRLTTEVLAYNLQGFLASAGR